MRGICLGDALKDNLAGLADPNTKVMEVEAGKKISYAFEVRHASSISSSIVNEYSCTIYIILVADQGDTGETANECSS